MVNNSVGQDSSVRRPEGGICCYRTPKRCAPVLRGVQTIITIEKGRFQPSVSLALRLARVFHTTVEKLFELQD
jgi:hypothetical protein